MKSSNKKNSIHAWTCIHTFVLGTIVQLKVPVLDWYTIVQGTFFMSNTEIVVETHPQVCLDLNHLVTSVLPKSSFLTPPTRRAPEFNMLTADPANLYFHKPLQKSLLLHNVFPFLQSDSYKITKPYIAPFDHEDRPQTLLVCGRRLAVLEERRYPMLKPSGESLFRFGNYFVTDDGKATIKTVVGDEKVPTVIFSRGPCNPPYKHRSLHTPTIV